MGIYDLSVVGVHSPSTNQLEVKEVRVSEGFMVAVVDAESEFYELPIEVTETIVTKKRVITTDVTDEPVVEKVVVSNPLLDNEGNHVFYHPTTIVYEQLEVGEDDEGQPIFETVERVEVSDQKVYCFTTEEVDVPTGEYWIEVEETEEVTTIDVVQVTDDDERWREGLKRVFVEKEIPLDDEMIQRLPQTPDVIGELAALKRDTTLLKAQNKVNADRSDFHEEVMTEIIVAIHT